MQTVVAHRAEVWSLGLDSGHDLLLTGSNEGELKAWKIEPDALMDGIKESEHGEVRYNVEIFEFVHNHSLIALEGDPPHIDTPSRLTLSCFSNFISPHASVSFCPVQ